MERSFREEVRSLRLGEGEVFHGEGILAVTKALLQSGVSYVSGYPGAPVSHLVDVLTDASDILDDLGVHFEPAGNEAGAAAMLGASINYPIRGAATWKSDGRHQCGLGCAVEPVVGGRDGRRPDCRRGGLRRGSQHHPGAGACLRDEVAGVAARSAPEPADHRRHGRARLCAVGGKLHAGDAGAAHPRLSRAWQLRVPRTTARRCCRAGIPSMRRSSTTRGSACRRRPTPRRSTRSTCAGRRPSATSRSTA